eukprot:c7218_g1_i1.p1 GENE.c7218_g1_i1~~c7218_g1_i1.p1  ORF type:complete len:234 (-),score=43.76 c7218_g1_i1:442-1101(-)
MSSSQPTTTTSEPPSATRSSFKSVNSVATIKRAKSRFMGDRLVREATETTESAERREQQNALVSSMSGDASTLSQKMLQDLERKQALIDAMRKKTGRGSEGNVVFVIDMGDKTFVSSAPAPRKQSKLDVGTYLQLGFKGRRRARRLLAAQQVEKDDQKDKKTQKEMLTSRSAKSSRSMSQQTSRSLQSTKSAKLQSSRSVRKIARRQAAAAAAAARKSS